MATNHADHLAGTPAGTLADALESGPTPTSMPSHRDLVLTTAGLIRRLGAADALGLLRLTLGSLPRYHDTQMVFLVWSVERLLDAGLAVTALLWHPLTSGGSELAWWDAETLRSDAAARHFVAPTLVGEGDPRPEEPHSTLALAG